MILLIDNYDSFTYNLVQYLGELGSLCRVYRNDRITLADVEASEADRLVISPGPCTPREAGVSQEPSCGWPGGFRFSGSVWDINVSGPPMEERSSGQSVSCMARAP